MQKYKIQMLHYESICDQKLHCTVLFQHEESFWNSHDILTALSRSH